MFGLTFSIFGGMTLATSVLVFAGEMLIGKQAKKEDKDENEQNDANFGIKDESITKGVEDTTVQLQIQDAEDGIEPIERHSLVPSPLVDSTRL